MSERCDKCGEWLDQWPNATKMYCPECDGPPIDGPFEAITHVLCRVRIDPNFWHYMIGTEGFARLCKAESILSGKPYREVRKARERAEFSAGRSEADVTIERWRTDLIRSVVRSGDGDDASILRQVADLVDASDNEIIRRHKRAESGALVS